MKILRSIGGSLLLFSGSIGVLISILTILDPAGTKMADDGDPFGAPPSFWELGTALIVWLVVMILGLFLVFRLRGKKHAITDQVG